MSAPQISTETLLATVDNVIDQARDDMRDLATIAAGRTLTEDEFAEYEFLGRTINHQTLQRDRLLAG